MLDPITFSLKVQHAAAIATCCAAGILLANLTRLVRSERMFLGMPFHRRSDELHTHHDYVAVGAAWNDHYGKRTHDVDVEHMR